MSNPPTSPLRPLAPGLILALVSILFGFVLGGLFGAAEDAVKNRLSASADSVFETVYQSDEGRRDAILVKSWSYLKRAHLHGGAIGAAALASIVLLGLLGRIGRLETLSAWAFGAGALVYAVFWLAAGFLAPSLGSTGAAKETLKFLAVPGAGLSILGLVGTLVSTTQQLVLGQRGRS